MMTNSVQDKNSTLIGKLKKKKPLNLFVSAFPLGKSLKYDDLLFLLIANWDPV